MDYAEGIFKSDFDDTWKIILRFIYMLRNDGVVGWIFLVHRVDLLLVLDCGCG